MRPPPETPGPTAAGGHADELRLHRGGRGRMLAGVAAGLADYFDVDPTLVRIGFVALAFLGGLAVPLYLAGWLLIPDEDTDALGRRGAPGPRTGPRRLLSRPRPTTDTPTTTERRRDALPLGPRLPDGPAGHAAADTSLRASDDERNAVADKLSRHYAEGRLDEAEFKTRLDTAMSATTRGDLHGLFHDLPPLPSEPPPRRRGTAASCPGSSWWPSSPSWRAPPCPSTRCTTCRGSSSPSSASSCGGAAGGHHLTGTTTTARQRSAELGHGPLSRATRTPSTSPGRRTDDGASGRCAPWPLFAGLPADELDELAALCDVSTAHPGQVVQAQDVPVRYWHVIPAATPSSSVTAPRSGCWAAATRGRSTRCSTSCARPSPWWRCRR